VQRDAARCPAPPACGSCSSSRTRGLGIGDRLVGALADFAREAGYREVVLWTNDILAAARRIYQRHGFVLVAEKPHRSFGRDLTGQDWRLDLHATPG
jgi:ribosomal protein S18 acetylase RimI-like enzyme